MKKLTFEEWFAKVNDIATKADYELKHGFLLPHELAFWKEQYENGLTPKKAWNKT